MPVLGQAVRPGRRVATSNTIQASDGFVFRARPSPGFSEIAVRFAMFKMIHWDVAISSAIGGVASGGAFIVDTRVLLVDGRD